MPYITKERREALKRNGTDPWGPRNAGELTYVLYRTCLEYLLYQSDLWVPDHDGVNFRKRSFQHIADVRAALVSTLSELDRRHFFPYEDSKILENGDVEI